MNPFFLVLLGFTAWALIRKESGNEPESQVSRNGGSGNVSGVVGEQLPAGGEPVQLTTKSEPVTAEPEPIKIDPPKEGVK